MKAKQIYQLVSYVNAWNKRKRKWESLGSATYLFVGKQGLKTAYEFFDRERESYHNLTTVGNWNKYSETRGKVELHIPHVHDNGTLAYWGDKIILSHNPDNI
jgi:hypothetical protein